MQRFTAMTAASRVIDGLFTVDDQTANYAPRSSLRAESWTEVTLSKQLGSNKKASRTAYWVAVSRWWMWICSQSSISCLLLSPTSISLVSPSSPAFPLCTPSIHSFCRVAPTPPPPTPPPAAPSLSTAGQEDYRSRLNGECFQDLVCPEKCRCEGTVVDCSNLKLTRVPAHIPEHTTDL